MVMHYAGSEVRIKSIARENNKFVRVNSCNEVKIAHAVERVAKYIRTAIVADYELYPYVNQYFKRTVLIRHAIEPSIFKPSFPSIRKKKLVIIHAPTNDWVKGTDVILDAIAKLKSKYDFEVKLVNNMQHKDAITIYKTADIVIDQILIGAHGVFALEAMALGKPVVCYIREDLRSSHPEELPIVSANPDDIYEQLKVLVENPELRRELGLRGREYVVKHHDSIKIAQQLIELYESL